MPTWAPAALISPLLKPYRWFSRFLFFRLYMLDKKKERKARKTKKKCFSFLFCFPFLFVIFIWKATLTFSGSGGGWSLWHLRIPLPCRRSDCVLLFGFLLFAQPTTGNLFFEMEDVFLKSARLFSKQPLLRGEQDWHEIRIVCCQNRFFSMMKSWCILVHLLLHFLNVKFNFQTN